MGCTQAEITRLVVMIDRRVFSKAKTLDEAKKQWEKLKETLIEKTIEELEAQLGVI